MALQAEQAQQHRELEEARRQLGMPRPLRSLRPDVVSSDGAEEAKQVLIAQRDALEAKLEQVQVQISTGCSVCVYLCACARA